MESENSFNHFFLKYQNALKNYYGRTVVVTLFILTCITSNSFSQNQSEIDFLFESVDSLANDSLKTAKIREIAFGLRFTNPLQGISILERLKNSSFHFMTPENPIYEDFLLGELHLNANNFKEAEEYLMEYHDFWIGKSGHENDMGASKLRLADLYRIKGDYASAISASLEAEDLFEQAEMIDMQIRSASVTASMLVKGGRKDEALGKLMDLIPKAKESETALSNVYNSISVIYDEYGPIDSALVYMYKYKDLTFKTPNLANQFVAIYNIATTEEKLGNQDEALKNINACFDLAEKSGIPILRPYALLTKGNILIKTGDYDEAKNLFDEAGTNDLLADQQSMLYKGRYELNKIIGNYRLALENHEDWSTLEDSLKSEEIAAKTNELEIQYESVKKENQISKLESEQIIQNQRLKMQKYGLIGLSLALIALGTLFYIIFRQRNQIKLQNEIISAALKEKETLLKEIHHRVKNNLQIISSLLSLQSRAVKDEQASSALEEGQNRVQSMALIHQHLYSGENITGVKVKNYLNDLCKNVFESHQIDNNLVKLDLDIEDVELDISSVVPLGLVLNELITNACKYAFPDGRSGQVSVSLKEKENQLIAVVSDDGVGFDNEKVNGFGSKLIQSFARKMDADLETKNEDGAFTRIIIKNYKKV